jgi:inner membrane protein
MVGIGHIFVGLASAGAFSTEPARARKAALIFAALALWPDVDALGFAFAVPYGAPLGHRGATHSLVLALLLAAAGHRLARRWQLPPLRTAGFVALVAASHGLLDTMTFGGGLGCALLWPFSLHRFWAPVRFIPVAPIGLDLLSARGLRVTAAEIVLFAPFWLYSLWALWLRPAAAADASRARPPLPWRALASLVLLLHAAAGGLVLWALPQGFPIAHWRWIANTALPVCGGITALYAVVAGWLGRDGPRRLLLSALCGGWAGAGLTGWLLFPLSSRAGRLIAGGPAPWLALLALAFAGLWALNLGRLQPQRTARAAVLAAALLGAMLGAAVLRAQRADAPATRPLGGVLPDVAPSAPPATAWSRIGRLSIQAARGELALSCGGLPVEVMPLLTFESRSPDRGWTFLAPPSAFGSRRAWIGGSLGERGGLFRYRDDGMSVLSVRELAQGVELEAQSRLAAPVYSHQNTWAGVFVGAPRQLQLGFSPAGNAPLDVLPSEYPIGKPIRLAFLEERGIFRVVQARSGEKGPFTTLAAGAMSRQQALTITVFADGVARCRLIFEDWAAQVATTLSPTAGWGLPANSIWFNTGSSSPEGAWIGLSLAETGAGRGWDTVGHGAGVYRNRMRIVAP